MFAYEANPDLEACIRETYSLNEVQPTLNSPTLCERCQDREATVRISVTTNAEERIQHLCAQCADASGGWRGRMLRLLNSLLNRAPSQ